jgi:hypothetical protein
LSSLERAEVRSEDETPLSASSEETAASDRALRPGTVG